MLNWIMSTEHRLIIVALVISLFGVGILVKLFTMQVLSADFYRSLSEHQQTSSATLNNKRGDIILKNKNGKDILAATTRSGFLIFANPRNIDDPTSSYERFSEIIEERGLSVNRDLFMEIASKKDDPFEMLLHRADYSLAEQIKKVNIGGVNVRPEEWRTYPFAGLASHVLGFFGFGKTKQEGRYGLELYYEPELSGSNISESEGDDKIGGAIFEFVKKFLEQTIEGRNLYLTLQLEPQQELENNLEKIVLNYKPSKAGGIIINPKTGEIIAMASRPDFDPNSYSQVDDISAFLNPNVSSVFEMGSVFKPLVMAAAIDTGSVTADTVYEDKGFVMVRSARISNYDGRGRGTVNMQEVLNQSLNTGMVFVGKKLGKNKMLEYFENFGLDEKTDIDLPSEGLGDIANLLGGGDVEYATASFGQGIAITPIQFARAASALANGGLLMRPHIVKEITGPDDYRKIVEPKVERRVFSERTSEEITRMLVEVVDSYLMGGGKGPKHYSVAAKTGTAQIANKDSAGYSQEYMHAFFGYAPAYDPKFLIFLFAEAPKGVTYASYSLGPSFLNLTDFLLNYYEVPPDR